MGGWISARSWSENQLQEVGRALDSEAAAVEDVGVDHGGLDRAVSEELLDGADVVAIGEEVGGEGVAHRVPGGVFAQAGLPHGRLEGVLAGGVRGGGGGAPRRSLRCEGCAEPGDEQPASALTSAPLPPYNQLH
jgi:hypothetical protein